MQNFEPLPVLNSNQIISNRYRLQQFLGRGAFGQVYAAEDIKFSPPKRVAIKIINPEYINDPVVREDVKREAGVMARFNHPYILRVWDFEVNPNLAYIITDLAEGGSLSSRIQPDPTKPPVQMPLAEVATLLEQIGSALDVAHAQGLVHRDIKPQNILIDVYGRPLLADFGLATTLNGSQKSVMVMATTSGTPPYMAPEQWTGQAGKASDIYALGVLTYQMVTGKTPFQGNQFELMGQHLNTPVPPISFNAPGLNYPPQLDQVLAEAMAKNPHNRIKSATELAHRFKAALQNGRPVANPDPQPVTEVVKPLNLPRVAPVAPAQPAQEVDPLRAETQVVGIPRVQDVIKNQGGAAPNYNQTLYPPQNQNYNQAPQPPLNQNYNQAPQPPLNQNYNPVYNPQGQVHYGAPVAPRKNNNNMMILVGTGIALALVLIVVIVAVSTSGGSGGKGTPVVGNNGNQNNGGGGRTVSSRTSLSLYPNVIALNVPSSYKQSRMNQYNQTFGSRQNAHDAQYFASSDNMDQIAQFFLRDAQSKGSIQDDETFNDGSRGIVFLDGRTGDVVFIQIIPPHAALAYGFSTGSNNVIEIID